MPIPRPESQESRVIAHVDMDCFYVQVEQRKQPELRGLPTAVVQYNSWKGGGLIAVSYEARKFGVKRSMRGDEAKKVCPNIQLVQVPVARGKADLNLYRNAGSEVVSILATKGRCERASIDEVYLDLTDAAELMLLESSPELLEDIDEEALKSHVLGLPCDDNNWKVNVKGWFCRSDADHRDKLLVCGAIIVAHLRAKVLLETKFTCSAGIAHNKMLAKLASAMHKPAQQTIVPLSSVKDLLASLPVKKMKQLGGKLGSSVQSNLGVNTVGDLLQFTEEKLQDCYGVNTGTWLWNAARGISGEEVEGRLLPKSHGCGKTFPGPQALKTVASVEHWLKQLCEELGERIQSDLDQNKRVARTLTLHAKAFQANDLETNRKFPSKSCPLRYGTMKIQEDAMRLFDSGLHEFLVPQNSRWGVTSLSVAASKILDTPPGTCSILRFFEGQMHSTSTDGSTGLNNDSTPSATSGKTNNVALSQNGQLRRLVLHEETGNGSEASLQNLISSKDTSVGKTKKKGSCSILSYFPSIIDSSCSKKQESDMIVKESPHKSGNHSHQNLKQIEENVCDETRNSWNFDVGDIDPSVVDELPLEIQKEIQGWLRPTKRVNKCKHGGSSIANYFSSL